MRKTPMNAPVEIFFRNFSRVYMLPCIFFCFKKNFGKYFFNRLPDIVTVRIRFPAETYGAVAVEKLLEERTARQPHPHAGIDGPIGV